jgi:hypothetical protein
MKVSRVLLVIAMLSGLAFSMEPSSAAKPIACVLAGGVNLDAPANLTTTTYGHGTFSASALLRCAGGASGQGTSTSSSFNFCQHNFVGPNPACHAQGNNGPTPQLDAVYDRINTTPAKIVAHAKGTATFGGFTGGVSCSLTFEGHATGTVAELVIQSFTCTNGYVMKSVKRAVALAVPVVNNFSNCPTGPGNVKLCFKTLEFTGVILGA